jgi:hypothetical protein
VFHYSHAEIIGEPGVEPPRFVGHDVAPETLHKMNHFVPSFICGKTLYHFLANVMKMLESSSRTIVTMPYFSRFPDRTKTPEACHTPGR